MEPSPLVCRACVLGGGGDGGVGGGGQAVQAWGGGTLSKVGQDSGLLCLKDTA